VKVSKRLAIFGFNLCASIFLGFCVYGLLVYTEGAIRKEFSTLFWSLCAIGIVACIVGICYFGSQWDMRNAEDAREARREGGENPGKRKKRGVTGR